jgi:uncharacterized repeat protein (TIGR02543 family)
MLNKNIFSMLTIIAVLMLVFAVALAATACNDAPEPTTTTPGGEVPGTGPGGTTSYTVTFHANGGSGTAPSAQTANSGSSITLPSGNGLTKNGYTFGGWCNNTSGTGTIYLPGNYYTPSGNVTLYAKWEEDVPTYTVTFDLNGGDGWPPEAQTVSPGSGITIPGESGFYRTRYVFSGWNTNASGTGTTYNAGSAFTPSGTVTLYAQWEVTAYYVTFDLNGGSGTVPGSRIVEPGSGITLPDSGNISLAYATFTGWNTNASGTGTTYAANSFYTPAGTIADITLYARWDVVPLTSVTGLANKLTWLQAHAQSNTSYTIEVNADESITGSTTDYSGIGLLNYSGSDITITLRGIGANRTVRSSSNDRIFAVGSGVTLVLDNNIILRGQSNDNNSLVSVRDGGTLVMNTGSALTGGHGVYMNGGTFTMNGGTISGNTDFLAGGVYVNGGTFYMNGGEISGNTASGGGGVFVQGGTFTMNGGTVSSNSSSDNTIGYGGGGVCVMDGTFTMNGGEISDNTAARFGGGVYVYSGLHSGTFTMSGGTISGNTASSGGGVYVMTYGTFTKTGGTIYGYSESDTVNSNAIKDSSGTVIHNQGHAVYVGGGVKRKEITAGPTVNLSYNGDNGSFSGAWDY